MTRPSGALRSGGARTEVEVTAHGSRGVSVSAWCMCERSAGPAERGSRAEEEERRGYGEMRSRQDRGDEEADRGRQGRRPRIVAPCSAADARAVRVASMSLGIGHGAPPAGCATTPLRAWSAYIAMLPCVPCSVVGLSGSSPCGPNLVPRVSCLAKGPQHVVAVVRGVLRWSCEEAANRWGDNIINVRSKFVRENRGDVTTAQFNKIFNLPEDARRRAELSGMRMG